MKVIQDWTGGGTVAENMSRVVSAFRLIYWLQMITGEVYVVGFYVCVFIVFLLIIDFLYVSHNYKMKRFSYNWPCQVLSVFCNLLITVMFIPVIGMSTH